MKYQHYILIDSVKKIESLFTQPLRQKLDRTSSILSDEQRILIRSFPSTRLVAKSQQKNIVFPNNYA